MRTVRLLPATIMRMAALRRWPVRRVLLKQIYFSGYQSLPLIVFIGAAVGGIAAAQLHYQIGQNGEGALKLLTSITFTELAPLLTAVVLTARSASAMASELALMRVHGELESLNLMGIDFIAYLILPRVMGMMLAAVTLTVYFALAAVLAGAIGVAGAGFLDALSTLPRSLPLRDLWLGMAKGTVFGVAIAVEACGRGLAGGLSGTDVPIAASQAVIRALLALFLLDLLIILLEHYL